MLEDILNEDILKPKKKKTIKASTLILVAIILLTLSCVGVIAAIIYFKSEILTIKLDGRNAKDLENIIIIQENDKIYLPIRRMANYLGYDAYNGDYITRSEDTTKCYIENDDELVSFILNSNVITKVINGSDQQIKIKQAITSINEELCITAEDAQEAFNINFYYDLQNHNIVIYTLDYLYNTYAQYYQSNGFVAIENETFANKSAILNNMFIVKTENGSYGVISTKNNSMILETKYDSIDYERKTSDFLVSSNNKKGIIKYDKQTKIELIYDDIKTIIDNNQIFYKVNQAGLYGLLDENGQILIYPQYEQIGIDVTQYKENGVTNGDILFNKVVPVKRNNKWALFNTQGNAITDFIYDSLGCTVNNSNPIRTYGVLQIPDYNLIVVSQNQKYNLITLEAKGLFGGFVLDSVYIEVSEGKNIYYVSSGSNIRELTGLLQENGITKSVVSE